MEELGSRFTEQHPEVAIEFINIIDGGPWGRDQLQRMIAGGEAPDLMMLNTGQFEAFGTRGALAELDERISGDSFDMGVYFQPAIDGCTIDGKIYGLPKDISDHVVYLNTDFFEAAGVELPTNEWTWADYRETAKALTAIADRDTTAPAPPTGDLRIGEVAAHLGVRTSTLRVWEQAGLLDPARERVTGHRLYTPTDVRLARIVRLLRQVHYPLPDIGPILHELGRTGDSGSLRVALDRRAHDLDRRSRALLTAAAHLHDHLDHP